MSDEMQDPHTTEDAISRLAHAKAEADAYLERNPDASGRKVTLGLTTSEWGDREVTIRLTAIEWGYVVDALYKAQSSMKWDARKMALRLSYDGFPFETEMTELTMMYVESKRWRKFANHIYEALVLTESENNDE